MTLGGSIFTHNCLKFDYCIEPAILSLVALCDEVVALDADSDDGTLETLRRLSKEHSNLRVYDHGMWECSSGWERLRILANQAKGLLNTDWHFMLQADEVIHESSFPNIRKAIVEAKGTETDSFLCARINLYGDVHHCLKVDYERPPCSPNVIRLGKKSLDAMGDAESLGGVGASNRYNDNIIIFHYGFVRDPRIFLDKSIDMQQWFHKGKVDPQLIEMKKKGGIFKPEEVHLIEGIQPLGVAHPGFARGWVGLHDVKALQEATQQT